MKQYQKLFLTGGLILSGLSLAIAQQKPQTQTGTASFYGTKFHGRRTASGEKFHKDSLTAAHHSYPFGTLIKVTNLKTGDSVVVKVNDRIAHKGRIVDLSPAAARKLHFMQHGTAKVKVEVVQYPK